MEADQECALVLVGDATELVSRDTAVEVEGVGFQPAAEFSPGRFQAGLAHIEKFRVGDPEATLDLFETVTRLEPKNPALPELKIDLPGHRRNEGKIATVKI